MVRTRIPWFTHSVFSVDSVVMSTSVPGSEGPGRVAAASYFAEAGGRGAGSRRYRFAVTAQSFTSLTTV